MTVIQTGSIALLSFLVGDYGATLLGDGEPSANISAVVAAGVVVGLTLGNVAACGSGGLQYALTALEVGGLVAVIIAGLVLAAPAPSVAPPAAGGGIALAMVFVLLTFGGWSEAAYISAELRDRRRGAGTRSPGGWASSPCSTSSPTPPTSGPSAWPGWPTRPRSRRISCSGPWARGVRPQ